MTTSDGRPMPPFEPATPDLPPAPEPAAVPESAAVPEPAPVPEPAAVPEPLAVPEPAAVPERVRPADPVTAAALDDVTAARDALAAELVRLEATARAAVDVRAKVKRNPGKTAAAVGGAAFLAVGGPRRVFRSVKHRIVGKPDPLPPSLLPDQVEKAVRALGDDGSKVRGALEREFAAFVETNRKSDSKFVRRVLLTGGVPIASQIGREVVKRLFTGSAEDVEAREEQIRARRPGGQGGPGR